MSDAVSSCDRTAEPVQVEPVTVPSAPAAKDVVVKPDAIPLQAITDQLKGLVVSIAQQEPIEGKSTVDMLAERLEPMIQGVLSLGKASRVCARGARLLSMVALGSTWGKALEKEGAVWADMSVLHLHPSMNALCVACRDAGTAAIRQARLSAAHSRAVDGWQEPVYGKDGEVKGSITRYSDRLLELLLKGDDPGRYNPQVGNQGQQQGSGGPLAIQINVHLPGSTPATVDVTPQPVVVE